MVISLGSILYIVYLLGFEKASLRVEVWEALKHLDYSVFQLLLLIVLMFCNWGCEIYKWRLLAGHMRSVSWRLAIKSTLVGVAASIFTPYKVGGYFGKVLLFENRYRAKGIVLQLYNSMALFIVNFFFGLLFLGILSFNTDELILGINPNSIGVLFFCGAFVVLIFWFLFIKVDFIAGVFDKIRWTKKWGKYWEMLSSHNYITTASKILVVSVIRYLIITSQYLLAYKIFGLQADAFYVFCASGALFFLFQFIPIFNAVELGVTRTAIFIFLLTYFQVISTDLSTEVKVMVTASSFCIWFLNLLIPAFIGSLYLSQVKIFKES